MPRKPGLLPGQEHSALDALAVADRELALVEHLLQAAYGRPVGGTVRTLRRQIKGLREEVRRRFLEQEVEQAAQQKAPPPGTAAGQS